MTFVSLPEIFSILYLVWHHLFFLRTTVFLFFEGGIPIAPKKNRIDFETTRVPVQLSEHPPSAFPLSLNTPKCSLPTSLWPWSA